MARLSKKAITEALQQACGRVTEAARRLGCSREHLHRRIRSDAALQAALDSAREELIDLAESKLVEKIRQGNLTAIIFALKTLGKQRGYTERMELQHSGQGEVRVAGLDPAEIKLKAERLLQWNAQQHKSNGSPAG